MKLLLVPCTALLLGGCISLAAKAPPSLLTLTADQAPAAGATVTGAKARSITVLVPAVPQALATTRVPVATGPASIAYIRQAYWSEAPARLFGRLMSDTIAARTGRLVLSNAESFGDPGAKLSGELRSFGVESAGNRAVVIYDAALMRDGVKTWEKRRFEARVPLNDAIAPVSAATALNRAANQVAGEVAAWVGQ
ncbi:ABC-type transport auxiliary lipoprotein family protein [Sphingomonas sp.]|uniref:ABC-type transport auxiliary lipoprotein family protein n=1 Tax=Sphingomonas sp. TaxID=28214 RepID=UPI001D456DF9|nr:ABC-type transport auxiliary lipoprotein family protein [Sphingomonas sp.]MBX9797416.1 ABC-type transport auxiliary lipoprotein family protein [Sphingomonas sp.]